jgi:uncharacterized protein YndB with AHSA1/START domain
MTTPDLALGTLEHTGDAPVVRFERRLPHPPERVWAALVEPEELAHWFPTTIEGERAAGAPLRFAFRFENEGLEPFAGTMVACDPPRLLAFTWGDSELRFELTPDGEGCLLRFTDTFAELGTVVRDTAGWHICLDKLVDHVSGRPAEAPTDEPTPTWQDHFIRYRSLFGEAAATERPEGVH